MFVFPMAGLSSRFTKAGYQVPKYQLDAGGKTLFWHSVAGFRKFFDTHPFLFIMRDVADTPAFVAEECRKMGILHPVYVVLDEPTSGQAETVALGLQRANVDPQTPITIFNIDTIRRNFEFPAHIDLDACDGYLEVFRGEGDHWSFVGPKTSDPSQSIAQQVTEKVRISDLCSTGLYHFKTAGLFLDVYSEIAIRALTDLQGGERYIAPLYDILIKRGYDIRYGIIGSDEVEFSGTPDEYTAFCKHVPDRPKVGALITGQLRHIVEAYETLGEVLKLREDGLIDEIVLSTWHGEIDKFRDLRNNLKRAGITTVESNCPSRMIRPQALWNAWLQAAAIRRGLNAMERSDCVLKLRTDKSLDVLDLYRATIQDFPEKAGEASPLTYKITSRLGRVGIPLHVNDIVYFGQIDDLKSVTNLVTDGRLEFESHEHWTGVETRWASGPFFQTNALYHSFHKHVDAFEAFVAISKSVVSETAGTDIPEALARVLLMGWRIFSDGFKIIGQPTSKSDVYQTMTVEQLLSGEDAELAQSINTRRGIVRNFRNQIVIEKAARLQFAESPLLNTFKASAERLDASGTDEALTADELKDIAEFITRWTGSTIAVGEPDRIIISSTASGAATGSEIFNKTEALKTLFARSRAPDDEFDAVVQIAQSAKSSPSGADVFEIANAYSKGSNGLERQNRLANYWWRIGIPLRHNGCISSFVTSVLSSKNAPAALLDDAIEAAQLGGAHTEVELKELIARREALDEA